MPCSNSICAASKRPMIIRSRPRILCASAFVMSSSSDCGSRVALFLQHRTELAVDLGRIGTQLNGVAKLRNGSVDIASLERSTAFGDIEVGVLFAVVGRYELAPLLELCGRFVSFPGARQRETELIVRFPARRFEARGLGQFRDRVGHLAVLKQGFPQCEARSCERR